MIPAKPLLMPGRFADLGQAWIGVYARGLIDDDDITVDGNIIYCSHYNDD